MDMAAKEVKLHGTHGRHSCRKGGKKGTWYKARYRVLVAEVLLPLKTVFVRTQAPHLSGEMLLMRSIERPMSMLIKPAIMQKNCLEPTTTYTHIKRKIKTKPK